MNKRAEIREEVYDKDVCLGDYDAVIQTTSYVVEMFRDGIHVDTQFWNTMQYAEFARDAFLLNGEAGLLKEI
jgi:hypothetical protein